MLEEFFDVLSNMKWLPWKQDRWLSEHAYFLKYDKLEHLLSALFGTSVLFQAYAWVLEKFGDALIVTSMLSDTWFWVPAITTLIGVGKEMWDGLYPYNGVDIQGFSVKDLIANEVGILFGCLFSLHFNSILF